MRTDTKIVCDDVSVGIIHGRYVFEHECHSMFLGLQILQDAQGLKEELASRICETSLRCVGARQTLTREAGSEDHQQHANTSQGIMELAATEL